jgi:hypothetical protein
LTYDFSLARPARRPRFGCAEVYSLKSGLL